MYYKIVETHLDLSSNTVMAYVMAHNTDVFGNYKNGPHIPNVEEFHLDIDSAQHLIRNHSKPPVGVSIPTVSEVLESYVKCVLLQAHAVCPLVITSLKSRTGVTSDGVQWHFKESLCQEELAQIVYIVRDTLKTDEFESLQTILEKSPLPKMVLEEDGTVTVRLNWRSSRLNGVIESVLRTLRCFNPLNR